MAIRFERWDPGEIGLRAHSGKMRAMFVAGVCVGPSWRSLEEALQTRRTPVETSLPAVRELMRLQQTLCSGTRPVLPQKQGV